MADPKDPFRQLFEVAVYAPIGLLMLARKELPAITASGKQRVESQITLAKFVGRIALTKGTQELKRRLDAAEAARRRDGVVVDADAAEVPMHAPAPDDVVALPDVIIAAVVEAEVAHDRADATASAVDTDGLAAALPIDGYDSLAASQVVTRLATLTADELAVIHDHELSHRNRRTILGKIHQLQAR